jgi:hypothetical protein
MKKVVTVIALCALLVGVSACSDNPNGFTLSSSKNQNVEPLSSDTNGEQALKYLSGAQTGDKLFMFEATNLTGELLNDCREKLINPTHYKQTDDQRKACETVLRTSGEIDYFSGPLKKLFPRSATLKVTRSDTLGMGDGSKRFDHTVTVTYNDSSEALSDKTGKRVKVMNIHLYQTPGSVNGRIINSFSFDGKGFDRFADKDFDVVTYY